MVLGLLCSDRLEQISDMKNIEVILDMKMKHFWFGREDQFLLNMNKGEGMY